MVLVESLKSAHPRRQRRGDSFTDLATETVPDSHFHPLDLSYVSSITHKVLHGAGREGFLSLGQVQPQSFCLHLAGAHDDDIDSGCSAGVSVFPGGQGEVIGDDWVEERMGFKMSYMIKCLLDILGKYTCAYCQEVDRESTPLCAVSKKQ